MKTGKIEVVEGIFVEAKEWQKGDQHRIYFQCSGKSKAPGCYDLNKREWVKIHGQFNAPFTTKVLAAFGIE